MITSDDRSRPNATVDLLRPHSSPSALAAVAARPDRTTVRTTRITIDAMPPVVDQPRITVVDGPGALARAVDLAHDGLEVLVIGVAPANGEALVAGHDRAVASGRLRWTTSFEDAIAFGDVHFVTAAPRAGTVTTAGAAATAAALRASVLGLVARATRRTLVVGCSPVPVGTAALLAADVTTASTVLAGVELAWVPDASPVDAAGRADGLTFGVGSSWAEAQLRAVFRHRLDEGTPLVVTDLETVELAAAVGWRAFRDGSNALVGTD